MAKINLTYAGKPPSFAAALPLHVELDSEEYTIADVKTFVASKCRQFSPSRQKLTLKGDKKLLSDNTTLDSLTTDTTTGSVELCIKDLGPQASWRVVYVLEYLGPLLIHPLFYHLPKVFYWQKVEHSPLQKYVYTFIMLHFLKRELESAFLHRFSHGTMPAFNLLKNCGHYWGLSGVLLAFDLYRPAYSNAVRSHRYLDISAGILLFAEVSNLITHVNLRNLRPAGSTRRAIPYGYGFSFPGLSCPNYFFETIAWLTICVMTNSIAAWIFFVVGVVQMLVWANKKHRAYKEEFGKEYPRRWAMLPLLF